MADTATITERTTIPIYTAEELSAIAARALAEARRRVAEIGAMPLEGISAEGLFDAWDRMSIDIEDAFGPIWLLNSVHPDAAVRDASDRVIIDHSVFTTELFQNEALYERVHAVSAASVAQRQYKKDLIEAFEDSGVTLAPEKRQGFRVISERLTELSQEFSKNIRENKTTLTFTPEECEGLPASYVERGRRDENGNVVVGFDYPEYVPFMMNAKNEAARRRYYVEYTNRGTPRNIEILDEIVALRKEIAELYEVPSFAHYVTKRRMVGNPETVTAFLDDVKAAVMEAEVRDLGRLAEKKEEMTGAPARIERWDVLYYRERVRQQRYDIDQEQLRQYFPTRPTLQWLLDGSERLYGLRFEEARVPVWHDDVLYRDVKDAATGELIGGIYLDLYPRPDKYKHAAAWPGRGVARRAGPEADQRAGGESEPRRADAQRAGDAAARVRARAARRSLRHGVQPARRHERGARFRGGAVADVRGVGEPAGEFVADARALLDVPGDRRAAGQAAALVAQVRQRDRLGAAASVRRVRHGAVIREAGEGAGDVAGDGSVDADGPRGGDGVPRHVRAHRQRLRRRLLRLHVGEGDRPRPDLRVRHGHHERRDGAALMM